MRDSIRRALEGENTTSVEPKGERELVVTRIFEAPPALVYRAWSEPALFQRWWVPKSVAGIALLSCAMDVRTGGKYRLEFGTEGSDSMAFHGRYLDVVANARIVWTNDEGEDGAITTVTFEDLGGRTLVTFHELYPTSQARDEALQGSAAPMPEQLDQLADMLAELQG
ncbi:SRPBCC family protein [Rhizobium halophytocola]|uniref:Uncharacterized protein YndB with AHSA1/START domain n=1 Tax=Rhizobium halophytocola TaxID=735519 RepID=A0ABS4E5M4_9HYPH|nr:SRPBCC family protein [Rhizobium halophytocola]MBP1853240.1 uncharacterized protein YndB with AHSA1/START domain [Rhizobium halophytocola]